MGGREPTPEDVELLDIDVGEVSLVDKAAIRRKFVRTKRDDQAEGDDVGTRKDPKSKAAPADTEVVEVSKAAGDAVNALASDYLDLVSSKANELKAQVAAGNVKKDGLWSVIDGIHSAMYKAQEQLYVVAKSLGVEIKKSDGTTAPAATETAPTAKADKKMTGRRRAELRAIVEQAQKLMDEFPENEEDEMGATETTITKADEADEAGGAGAGGAQTGTQPTAKADELAGMITAAVEKAVKPIGERVVAIEQRVEKALAPPPAAGTETKPTEKAEPLTAAAVQEIVAKAIEPVAKRLQAVEANPGTQPGSTTEKTPTEKAAGGAGGGSMWSGIV